MPRTNGKCHRCQAPAIIPHTLIDGTDVLLCFRHHPDSREKTRKAKLNYYYTEQGHEAYQRSFQNDSSAIGKPERQSSV